LKFFNLQGFADGVTPQHHQIHALLISLPTLVRPSWLVTHDSYSTAFYSKDRVVLLQRISNLVNLANFGRFQFGALVGIWPFELDANGTKPALVQVSLTFLDLQWTTWADKSHK
jgi:hypothetical protein